MEAPYVHFPLANANQLKKVDTNFNRLDGKHVVFGRVANKVSKDMVKRVATFGSHGGNPKAKLTVDRCHCNH